MFPPTFSFNYNNLIGCPMPWAGEGSVRLFLSNEQFPLILASLEL